MDVKNMTAAEIKQITRQRFTTDNYVEEGYPIPTFSEEGEVWVDYEDYMKAIIFNATPGELGRLIVDFPPEATEDNDLHSHPISDRIITVISGSGWFICVKNKILYKHELKPGTRVYMPRAVLHTFMASEDGLTVESFHNPYVEFENPKCLTYLKNHGYEF